MKKTVLGTLSGIKYVYLLLFFALLAGVFQPFISEQSILGVIKGMGVLCRNFACIQSYNIITKTGNFSNIWVRPGYYFINTNLRNCG